MRQRVGISYSPISYPLFWLLLESSRTITWIIAFQRSLEVVPNSGSVSFHCEYLTNNWAAGGESCFMIVSSLSQGDDIHMGQMTGNTHQGCFEGDADAG